MSVTNSGAIVEGAPQGENVKTVKAKVIRGVYIRGTPYPEGAIVEVSGLELAELRSTNYAIPAPVDEPVTPIEIPTLLKRRGSAE